MLHSWLKLELFLVTLGPKGTNCQECMPDFKLEICSCFFSCPFNRRLKCDTIMNIINQ